MGVVRVPCARDVCVDTGDGEDNVTDDIVDGVLVCCSRSDTQTAGALIDNNNGVDSSTESGGDVSLVCRGLF